MRRVRAMDPSGFAAVCVASTFYTGINTKRRYNIASANVWLRAGNEGWAENVGGKRAIKGAAGRTKLSSIRQKCCLSISEGWRFYLRLRYLWPLLFRYSNLHPHFFAYDETFHSMCIASTPKSDHYWYTTYW